MGNNIDLQINIVNVAIFVTTFQNVFQHDGSNAKPSIWG